MSKIEVGMLVRVSDSAYVYRTNKEKVPSPVKGKTGRVISFIGNRPALANGKIEDFWMLDIINYRMAGYILTPIPPDEPADEDFQEDLKLWLDKKVTV